jgi:hypothetical protein
LITLYLAQCKTEYEGFIGCKILDHVQIHPPIDVHSFNKKTDVHSKGMSERMLIVQKHFCTFYFITVGGCSYKETFQLFLLLP